MLNKLKEELDGYVASGKLTQEQEDLILKYYAEQMALGQNVPGFRQGGRGMRGGFGQGRGMGNGRNGSGQGQGTRQGRPGKGGRGGFFGSMPAAPDAQAQQAPDPAADEGNSGI